MNMQVLTTLVDPELSVSFKADLHIMKIYIHSLQYVGQFGKE